MRTYETYTKLVGRTGITAACGQFIAQGLDVPATAVIRRVALATER